MQHVRHELIRNHLLSRRFLAVYFIHNFFVNLLLTILLFCDKAMQFLSLILVFLRVNRAITDVFIDSDELLIDIDLPESHLSQYFNNWPDFAKKINETSNGLYKEFLSSEKYDREACWGYEHKCKKPGLTHRCPGHHSGYVKSKEAQLEVFYAQTDFGKLQKTAQGHNIK